ncbi:SDR family NAD(P)-dependent oxidoreductase [Micromonospora sp. CA-259024]|uniref:SDR family NAD(P)-dependent oxidoreductase n=1 Tax=Micromonospora sp. CA-259024 TaxID=3239965 RepID=UPI003D8D24FC
MKAAPTAGNGRAVVVTGASRGIGAVSAVRLSSEGFRVYAAVRAARDADEARTLGLIPLRLDLTDAGSIEAAAHQVTADLADGELYGLVNSAGIVLPAPLEHMRAADFRHQLEVGLTGQLVVTQAFLPLLRAARGRIVNVSSVSGRVASPFIGAYSAAKHGLEGLSDALRRELRPSGVHVSVVQPGAIATELPAVLMRDVEAAYAELPPVARQHYGDTFLRYGRALAENHARHGSPPETVARAVLAALTARRPRTRYAVGAQAGSVVTASRLLPDRLLDWLLLRTLERTAAGRSTGRR